MLQTPLILEWLGFGSDLIKKLDEVFCTPDVP